jgi:hypothetical protein
MSIRIKKSHKGEFLCDFFNSETDLNWLNTDCINNEVQFRQYCIILLNSPKFSLQALNLTLKFSTVLVDSTNKSIFMWI